MVEALGGSDSEHYSRFISYCCESFNIFRKSAHLILNLLRLMIDANIPDLSSQPERALRRVEQNFRLDLTDEEAIQYFQNLIADSVSALAPQIAETFHRVAMYWRS
ncbi:uncharacterized protein AMSG_11664 [Thecamonas trahens ATCC 50062]|uniref:PI3K/PI4K catalytic domain-containing protein n=1 Tax=Thecamonas trahens ATCC 50062 TaxID=461836 RepID=A0A0L0DTF8_THETB|nr:hypothetical protein AMSG_11664 [Thecamonas trahens ATCC 50062]KNC55507.1 hypothetical protein AMSG_11664 [Thecamonas trahens ATCC 50062]|eukprot:XP_013761470.1 hypothetical protein AMSG_11664 [Thecamonas trahens ATCC 50062]